VRWRRETNAPRIFGEFDWLAKQVMDLDRRAVGAPGPQRTTVEEARYVLEGEARLPLAANPFTSME